MAIARSKAMAKLVRQLSQLKATRAQTLRSSYSTFTQTHMFDRSNVRKIAMPGGECNSQPMYHDSGKEAASVLKHQIGENVSRKDKINFLITTLLDLKDSKEAVYGVLDAWVAWEQSFPIASLKRVLITLENEQQWHRVIQVIKWMLSKGQGTTMGTYGQLIRALDMDHRAAEAHKFWMKKIGTDLHSVPWQLCHMMISVYYRNNMLEDLVKLFKGLESYDRKPPDKLVVKKVADAYEMLGLLEEKERILEKYNDLFNETPGGKKSKKSGRFSSNKPKSGQRRPVASTPGDDRGDEL